MCYNTITYKSPPVVIMTAGGLEPPRQLASGCQDRYVCQFHHAVSSENLEGESLPAETPSKSPCNKNTPDDGCLSRVICGENDIDGIVNREIMEADMARLVKMCPSCRSRRMKKYDIYRYGGTSRTRYKCGNCGKLTIYPLMKLVAERKKK